MENIIEIRINESELKKAASEGMDAFLEVFTSHYREAIGDKLTTETMQQLTGEQLTLLGYDIFREEMTDGGFIQLIQNGYGPFFFCNPFAKAMRLWGLVDFQKLIYKAKKVYDEHREDLERERSDEDFMALYEEYEQFDDLDDAFITMEEEVTEGIAHYVDEHIELFGTVDTEAC